MELPRHRILMLALAALAVGAFVLMLLMRFQGPGMTGAGMSGAPDIGGPFSLSDHHGGRVTEAALLDHLTVIYFGYASCPDVCPLELQNIGAAFDLLNGENPEKLAKIQGFFITVDPERDTVAALADYMPNFHAKFSGLTGTPAEIATATKAYKVYANKAGDTPAGEAQLVDHSSIIYLMGPDGKFLAHFGAGTPAEQIAAKLREYL